MDSRLIYSAINSSKLQINWKKHGKSEWFYVGTKEGLNTALVVDKINEHFIEYITI